MFRLVLAALVGSVIVAISPPHASAEGGTCPPADIGNIHFKAANPPRPMPDEPFIEADGEAEPKLLTIPEYAGRGLVLNFWATWCGPCVREMPSLSKLAATLKAAGEKIDVVALSQDRAGAPVVKAFFDKKGIANLDVMIDKRGRLGRKVDIEGLPVTLLIGPDGTERGLVLGGTDWDSPEALKLIRACIAPRG